MSTSAQAKKLATLAIKAARIKPCGTVTRQEMEKAVAGAITVTHPRSPHGQALMMALSAPVSQINNQMRPEHRAIRWLVARGQTPTEAATAGRMKATEIRLATIATRRQGAQVTVGTDGPRAAAVVAGVVAETGTGPTWHELAAAMDWPHHRPRLERIMRGLARAGWLTFTDQERSLRPGPLAASPAVAA